MSKLTVVFYKDAMVKNKKYNKDDVFEFIRQQRKNAKIKNVTVQNRNGYNLYTLLVNKDIIEVACPTIHKEDNEQYERIMQRWYTNDKKRNLLYLKLAAVGAAAVIAGVKLAPHIAAAMDKTGEKIEETMDNAKFYLGNLDQIIAINELEKEVRAHAGYGEVDGYKQSIQDHEDSYFALEDSVIGYYDVAGMINEYCDVKGLGDSVAEAAEYKYSLLSRDNIKPAYEIDLLEIYKEEKMKTLK